MEVALTALAAQLLLLYILSKLIIYIDLRYQRSNTDDYIAVNVYLGKTILLYSMKVPMIDLVKNDELLWLESSIKTNEVKVKTHIHRERRFLWNVYKIYFWHPRRLKRMLRSVQYYSRLYRRIVLKLVNSLACEHLKWETKYGSDDAAITGIMTGAFWALKGMLVTVLKRRFVFREQPQLSVSPVFGQPCFEISFQCIFSLRLGKIINATTIFVNFSGKGAKTGGRTSNPRANENSYGKHKEYD
ncbi:hypothetical protein SDC9_05864 [bioreactor metagenome]|uniref:DUF2953 domain-containing protein n=1 Tax=bioreactor metagenome TaxID=1076179 RepID=A0A644T093_9ZZZZ|nr:DUF2953 domain-containing protein [Negativicutes bacterium]